MRIFCFFIFAFATFQSESQKVFGTVFTDKGDVLPFSSITVKGTSLGASANNAGKFSFSLNPGNYTLICQHVGFATVEKTVSLESDQELTFILSEQKLTMKEVIVKTNAEDPAYEIIRQAIKKRDFYYEQVPAFTCELYGKDVIKLRSLPDKMFGKKIEANDKKEMGVDSTGKGVIYLSESVSKVSLQRPDKFKLEVLSSRVSGTESFGFAFPSFISLYQNNVKVFSNSFNSRGFISPIADGALRFYRYRFMGTFFEDGKAINAIKVIPRRNYEPLFSGTINITDDDWRIHSFDLTLTKKSQLEFIDTLQITQLHVPVSKDVWRVKSQVLHFNLSFFKVDAIGDFLNVYSDYNLKPEFDKKFFNNVLIKYDTAVNKKPKTYWDSIRPVPLEAEEFRDYKYRDSLYLAQKDSLQSRQTIDSLKKNQRKVKPFDIFLNGIHRTHYSRRNQYSYGIEGLLLGLEYNPAEGLVAAAFPYYEKDFVKARKQLSVSPGFRYGFSNTHLNAWVDVQLRTRNFGQEQRKFKRQVWEFSGGKRVSQFNPENPIPAWRNSMSTLFAGRNYMKTYEDYFGRISFTRRFESGLRFTVQGLYEDRIPLNNTTNFTFSKKDSTHITPNFPFVKGLDSVQFPKHQALILSFSVSFKPGQKYIQLPYSKVPIGSKYPTFSLSYSKGISGVFGSDVNFDKWQFSIFDDKNLKLAGLFKYRVAAGGFINNHRVYIQDFTHFRGNQGRLAAGEYLSSFQLLEYYKFSNINDIFTQANIEHHFNGLLTNKIPLFRRLKWNLVVGSNAFYVNRNTGYAEIFVGLENIFKVFRLDFITGYEIDGKNIAGIKLGGGGFLGNRINRGGSTRRRGNSLNINL